MVSDAIEPDTAYESLLYELAAEANTWLLAYIRIYYNLTSTLLNIYKQANVYKVRKNASNDRRPRYQCEVARESGQWLGRVNS